MNKIISKQQLADEVFRIEVEAPLIAAARQPGQFVIVQLDTNFGERIPLTIADYDKNKGTITLIFRRSAAPLTYWRICRSALPSPTWLDRWGAPLTLRNSARLSVSVAVSASPHSTPLPAL